MPIGVLAVAIRVTLPGAVCAVDYLEVIDSATAAGDDLHLDHPIDRE
jgi:hypothetical protein